MNQTTNPLANYFRKPGMSLMLPSKYYYYDDDMLELTITNELEVFPMTASDELNLRNPDALLNGSAVCKLIESCVPGIKDARFLVNPDFNALLLAIRAVTFGNDYAIDVLCPSCGHQNSFSVDSKNQIDQMTYLEPPYIVKLNDGLNAEIKPYSLIDQTRAAITAFEQGRALQTFQELGGEDKEKQSLFYQKTFDMVKDLKIELLSNSILQIIIDEKTSVVDKSHIAEFLNNSHKANIKLLEEGIQHLNNLGIDKTLRAECDKCHHEWEIQDQIDPSSFFG